MLGNALLVSGFEDLVIRLKCRILYRHWCRVPSCVQNHWAGYRGGALSAFFSRWNFGSLYLDCRQ